jgi:hypothetical protein
MIIITVKPKFPLGQLVITPNARDTLSPELIQAGLNRHCKGDWGNVPVDDRAANDLALIQGDRVLSAYGNKKERFWIITEADRSVTTILMPEDY